MWHFLPSWIYAELIQSTLYIYMSSNWRNNAYIHEMSSYIFVLPWLVTLTGLDPEMFFRALCGCWILKAPDVLGETSGDSHGGTIPAWVGDADVLPFLATLDGLSGSHNSALSFNKSIARIAAVFLEISGNWNVLLEAQNAFEQLLLPHPSVSW